MMRDWSDFFPDVLPAVELGTPEPTVVHQLRRAAQDFCHRTRAWRMTLEPITTVDGQSEYAIPLPEQTTLFLCHDYKAEGRSEYRWETTVREQRENTIHVRDGVSEAAFVEMRTQRDRTLAMPRLLLPSVQVNMRAGAFPPAEENGIRYLKIPVDAL